MSAPRGNASLAYVIMVAGQIGGLVFSAPASSFAASEVTEVKVNAPPTLALSERDPNNPRHWMPVPFPGLSIPQLERMEAASELVSRVPSNSLPASRSNTLAEEIEVPPQQPFVVPRRTWVVGHS